MPAQYPGNVINKLARKANGGYESAISNVPTVIADVVEEGFESGTMDATQYPNWDWTTMNKTSIVTMANGNPTILYTGSGPQYTELVGDPRDWTALTGNNSLRIAYPQSTSGTEDEWAEQKWEMINDYYPGFKEIWARWSIRVPTNYYHRLPSSGGTNNKFATFYCDGYTNDNPTGGFVGFEMWPYSTIEPGGCRLSVNPQGGTGGPTDNQGHSQHFPFIVPSDAGRWMHICIQIILCNVHTDANGQVRSWRKWDGATEWELMHEKLDSKADQPDAITGIDGIRRGYLMGWANTGMDVSQEWLIDDFKLSTASLL